MKQPKKRGSFGVRVIAFGKTIQMLLTLGVGIAALLFVDAVPPESVQSWVNAFAPHSDWLQEMVEKIVSSSDKKLFAVGAGALAYSALFAVESYGLWRERTWAESLTVTVTTSFIPFEIYGLTQEFSIAKIVTLVINGIVVVNLSVRIVLDRREKKASNEEREEEGKGRE